MNHFPFILGVVLVLAVAMVSLSVTVALSAWSSDGNASASNLLMLSAPYKHGAERVHAVAENDDAGDVAKGEKLYQLNCSACHQKNGKGKVGFAPSIRNKDFLALASDDFIATTITKGRAMTTMIPRPDLKGEKVKQIIAYLRADFKGPVITNDKKIYKGDAAKGAKGFKTYCSACHGPKGEGYFAGVPGTGIGLKSFLDNASDDYIFQTLKRGRVGTAMKSMIGAVGVANLSEQEAIDIIAHLRSLNK